MSNNYWQSQNQNNQNGGQPNSGMPPRKSGLLSNYGGQQNTTPNNYPGPQGPAPSFPSANQMFSGPQGGPPSQQLPPPQQQWNGPSFMARPAQMVQRFSNKMAAMRRPGQQVDQNPMVRYHNPQPPALRGNTPVPATPTPWRRSRVQRINHLKKRRRERNPGNTRLRTMILSSIAAILLILITTTAGYAYNFYSSELPQVQALANGQIKQSTRIYDRHGTLLYTLYKKDTYGLGGRSTPISYQYVPGVLQDAQIAAEDPTFWTNNGVDPQGVLRALSQTGSSHQTGGSTMTQQLIKNLSGNAQDNIQRKASEAALAIGLTNQYPKWKIMEMYFNVTPYGAQDKGVEAAVEDYFGLKPICDAHFNCTPAVAFLDRDLTKCKNTNDQSTCANDPSGMLGLARAVLLAGIPQNPTHFDPSLTSGTFQNVLTNRVPYVIEQMIKDNMDIRLGLGANADDSKTDLGPMTPDMEAKLIKIIGNMDIKAYHDNKLAPHFVDWVIDTLALAMGNGNYDVGYGLLETAGLNVYTTLDLPLEQYVEADVKHNLDDRVYQEFTGRMGPLNTQSNVNDSAAVVMDSKTGEVLAMNGSSDYTNTGDLRVAGQVNAATSYLNPGSTMKPFVYATAFENGWYPGIRLIDEKTYFPRGASQSLPVENSTYHPTDYQNQYHTGTLEDVRVALSNSFNIPAIKTLMYAGLNNVADTLRRVGITAIDHDLAVFNATHPIHNTLEQYFGPSLALGTAGIPLVQMVDGYQTFADDGIHVPSHNILDIWDNYGHNLYHYDPTHPNGARVFSEQVNYLVTNMLSDNHARRLEFAGTTTLTTLRPWNQDRPVAAKTGTTDNFKDNWTLGFTSGVVVGVWSGNANGDPMAQNVIGITGAGPIWHDIMTYAIGAPAYQGYNGPQYADHVYSSDPFPQPSGVVQVDTNNYNGLQGTGMAGATGDGVDWMIQGEQPQQTGLPTCPTDPNNPGGNPGGNPGNPGNPSGGNPPTSCPPTNPGGPGGNQGGNSSQGIPGGIPGLPYDPFGGN